MKIALPALLLVGLPLWAAPPVPLDVSAVRPGPITVTPGRDSVTVRWPDEQSRPWTAVFSLDRDKPLISAIGLAGRDPIVTNAAPIYDGEFGKRRGGWDEFFDFPPSAPEGTRRYPGALNLTAAQAASSGGRVELRFNTFSMGPFHGSVAFTFYPGSRLLHMEAVASTQEPDVAYYYNAGLKMGAPLRAGDVMDTRITYYDTSGQLQTVRSGGPERTAVKVRYRALAVGLPGGTAVAFPPPHQYFMARDFTTNMGYLWHYAWRGEAAIGIRQYPDDNSVFYPWMNAPPGTAQRMGMFVLLDDRAAQPALQDVLRYTHNDRFPRLEGYRTLAAHWHPDFAVQAMDNNPRWVPPFKPVLQQMGVDSMLVFDFHIEGHPDSLGPERLQELAGLFKAARAQSTPDFLIIPAEEADVWFGGHFGLMFPKPVYWFKQRPKGTPLESTEAPYGKVWHIGSPEDLLAMVRAEGGYVYQTHPRTKGSKGFPDQIRNTAWFTDPHYFGAGWKAMPSDLSSPRLGERAFRVIDDINNWGMHKLLTGEVDVFQVDSTHELYGHMNINYLRMPALPDYDHYGDVLRAMTAGDSFITTGEVLLPSVKLSAASGDTIAVKAQVSWTFPLRMAEIVWGDGSETRRQVIELGDTRDFGKASFDWTANAPRWKWARLAVWDIAGNGAFTQPVLR